jgi:hypothetical protein
MARSIDGVGNEVNVSGMGPIGIGYIEELERRIKKTLGSKWQISSPASSYPPFDIKIENRKTNFGDLKLDAAKEWKVEPESINFIVAGKRVADDVPILYYIASLKGRPRLDVIIRRRVLSTYDSLPNRGKIHYSY